MYLDQMAEDPERARHFTRMLYELHQPLADELAGFLDLSGVDRLMDLGGGSGAMSLALLRRYPKLTVTVVDIANVCAAGSEIAAENSLEDRITFHPADFLQDELPSRFDVVLECDVNVYSEEIVDQFAPAEGVAPPSRLHWAFEGSLTSPEFVFPTAARIQGQLERAGFRLLSEDPIYLKSEACTRFMEGLMVVEARK
jgi:predicted TPR repeat methyltransferase